mgnify:CR=1 FL=1
MLDNITTIQFTNEPKDPINTDSLEYAKLDLLDFEVRIQPLLYQTGVDGSACTYSNIDQNFYKAVIKFDRKKLKAMPEWERPRKDFSDFLTPIGVVGNKYNLVSNNELFNSAKKALLTLRDNDAKNHSCIFPANAFDNVEVIEKPAYKGRFSRFELLFHNLTNEVQQGPNSKTNLKFRICVENTFNGDGKIRVTVGFHDEVCSNGLIIGEYTTMTSKHTNGFNLESFMGFIADAVINSTKQIQHIQTMADTRLATIDAEDFLKKVFSERKADKLTAQFRTEASTRGFTVWSLVSALTHYSSHDSDNFGVSQHSTTQGSNVSDVLSRREREVKAVLDSDTFKELLAA